MAGLDDLFNQIPVADLANKLGADPSEVQQAVQTLVPTLLGTMHENVASEDIDSTHLESAAVATGESDLLDGGVNVDQLDENQGNQMVASLFGGNDTTQVASALSGAGAPGGDLIRRLLPMLAPIVLAYVGRQFSQQRGTAGAGMGAQAGPMGGGMGGGMGNVLGSILGGAGGMGGGAANNPLGSILGGVLGGGQGGALGGILGGLLRGGR